MKRKSAATNSEAGNCDVRGISQERKDQVRDALDEILRSLKCSVCQSTVSNPDSLPCGHFYCHQCLDNLTRFARCDNNQPTCPQCRAGFSRRERIKDEALRNIVTTFRRLHQEVCDPLDLTMLSQDSNYSFATPPRPMRTRPFCSPDSSLPTVLSPSIDLSPLIELPSSPTLLFLPSSSASSSSSSSLSSSPSSYSSSSLSSPLSASSEILSEGIQSSLMSLPSSSGSVPHPSYSPKRRRINCFRKGSKSLRNNNKQPGFTNKDKMKSNLWNPDDPSCNKVQSQTCFPHLSEGLNEEKMAAQQIPSSLSLLNFASSIVHPTQKTRRPHSSSPSAARLFIERQLRHEDDTKRETHTILGTSIWKYVNQKVATLPDRTSKDKATVPKRQTRHSRQKRKAAKRGSNLPSKIASQTNIVLLCPTKLSKAETSSLRQACETINNEWEDSQLLVTICNNVADATHVITGSDKLRRAQTGSRYFVNENHLSQTSPLSFKFLMAVLMGKWVVNVQWILDSIHNGMLISERFYEIKFDTSGGYLGPLRGRMAFGAWALLLKAHDLKPDRMTLSITTQVSNFNQYQDSTYRSDLFQGGSVFVAAQAFRVKFDEGLDGDLSDNKIGSCSKRFRETSSIPQETINLLIQGGATVYHSTADELRKFVAAPSIPCITLSEADDSSTESSSPPTRWRAILWPVAEYGPSSLPSSGLLQHRAELNPSPPQTYVITPGWVAGCISLYKMIPFPGECTASTDG